MKIWQSVLAGVGPRHAFTTAAGRHIGVIAYRTGRRDLVIRARSDRDSTATVVLTSDEARCLAALLWRARIVTLRPGPGIRVAGPPASPGPPQTQPDRRVRPA